MPRGAGKHAKRSIFGILGLLGVLAGMLAACQIVVGIPDRWLASGVDAAALNASATSVADAGEPDSNAVDSWACVGSVNWPATNWPAATTEPLTVTQPYYNFDTGDRLPGIWTVPCNRIDPACAHPLTSPQLTDEGGVVSFPLYYGFNGYFLSLWDASLPMMLYINPPAYTPAPQVVGAMVPTDSLEEGYRALTAGLTGVSPTLDPARGHVMVAAYDCNGQPAPGVTISLSHADPQTVQLYYMSGLPNASATETDATGFYVALNVPTGAQTITMTLAATGKELSSASIYVAAAYISQINMPPSPL
jgi:hypothetical protein